MRDAIAFALAVVASLTACLLRAAPAAAAEWDFPPEKVILATNRLQAGAETTAAFKAEETGPLTFFTLQPAPQGKTVRTAPLTRESLAKHLASTAGGVLVYVHGFGNTVDDAIVRAVDNAAKMRFPGSVAVFSWPSLGSVFRYRKDVRIAEKSSDALLDLLTTLTAAPSVGKVHVLAHSLGNQVLVDALVKYAATAKAGGKPLGEVIFCAPDVERSEFAAKFQTFRPHIRGATLWGSNSDRALPIAWIFGRRNRAGLFIGGPFLVPDLDTIDVSAETGLFRKNPNHTPYRQDDKLFHDLGILLNEPRVTPWSVDKSAPARQQPLALYDKILTPAGVYWRLKRSQG